MKFLLLLCLICMPSVSAANSYLDQNKADIMQSSDEQNKQLQREYSKNRAEAFKDTERLQQLMRRRPSGASSAAPWEQEPPVAPYVQTPDAPYVEAPPVTPVVPEVPAPAPPINIYR